MYFRSGYFASNHFASFYFGGSSENLEYLEIHFNGRASQLVALTRDVTYNTAQTFNPLDYTIATFRA